MKKITLFLASVMISFVAISQTFVTQSFDATTFPPTGWTNVGVPSPSADLWLRATVGNNPACPTHTGAGMARFNSYDFSTGTAAALITPSFNLSSVGTNLVRVSFWMYKDNAYATEYDSLDVYIGTSLTSISSATHLGKINRNTGLAPAESADGWYKYYFDIPSSFNGATNYIFFKATSDWGNDIHIDDILVQVVPANDAGITAINTPNTPVSIGSTPITATIKNFGGATLANATVAWTVNGVAQTPSYTFNGPLATSATAASLPIGTYNFPSVGFYTIKLWTSNPNGLTDGDNTNDTITKLVYVQGYAALPFTENFDGTWVNKLDTSDVPSLFWINTPAFGNQSWRRNDQAATGNWTSPTSYGYTPTGSLSTSNSARFHSGRALDGTTGTMDAFLDFTNAGSKTLKFWYINTNGTDSLKVYLSTDGGSSFAFQDQYTIASTWQLKQLSLGASTSSTVVVRFMAISDDGSTDIGLDGVQVSITQPDDVGIISILNRPLTSCGLVSDSVNVVISNFGSTSQSGIPVVVKITTPSSGDVVLNQTYAGTLASNAMDTLFVGFANTSSVGAYVIKAYTTLGTDVTYTNDTITNSITVTPPTYPFAENFEATTALTNWTTNMYRTSSATAHGNTSYVMYKNLYNSTSASVANATLNKTLGTLTSTSVLTFDYRYIDYELLTGFTLGLDSLKVQISEDCGSTFTTVHVITVANHVTSANMKNVLVSLSAYSGKDIIVKFIAKRGTTGDYYIDIDNVEVLDAAYVGVNEHSNISEIKVYPNPSIGIVNVISNGFTTNANLNVYNLQGQSVYSETI
ncbi:MAG: T9SS type A sorting domain-containing protein, partial [Bacteroidetes bacterium]|nr:T9SS type A sorting domain-containing protein [Bacteroidota bacterium]